jgi:hypothetical protein
LQHKFLLSSTKDLEDLKMMFRSIQKAVPSLGTPSGGQVLQALHAAQVPSRRAVHGAPSGGMFDEESAKKLLLHLENNASVKRLSLVKQHGCEARIHIAPTNPPLDAREYNATTAWGSAEWTLNYSRLSHVTEVQENARSFAVSRSVPPQDAFALDVAALLHDTGHLALSHTGEHLVRKLLSPKQWNATFRLEENVLDELLTKIVQHEERSVGILRNILFKAPDPVGFDREAVFKTCAWLIHPKRYARPKHTSFGENPLSATTLQRMDVDRATYLVIDAPPCLRLQTAMAAHAWLTRECEASEAHLVRLRSLLHKHVYPAITQALLERVEAALDQEHPKDKLFLFSHLLRDATSASPPVLSDIDFLKRHEPLAIRLSREVRDEFLALRQASRR